MIDRRSAVALALTACATVFASCGDTGTSPTGPSGSGPWTGVWQGTLTDTHGTTGTLRLTLDERPVDAQRSFLSGSWSTSFADSSRNGSGSVAGTATDTTGTLLFTPSAPATCSQTVLGAAGSYSLPQVRLVGASLQGAYTQLSCTGTVTGTLAVRKP
jgi:hypothetical protein